MTPSELIANPEIVREWLEAPAKPGNLVIVTLDHSITSRQLAEAFLQQATELSQLRAERQWRSIKTIADLPQKPGLVDYEQIDCMVIHKGNLKHLVWNCEHGVWDEHTGDDYYCDALEPTAYMIISWPDLTKLTRTEQKEGV